VDVDGSGLQVDTWAKSVDLVQGWPAAWYGVCNSGENRLFMMIRILAPKLPID